MAIVLVRLFSIVLIVLELLFILDHTYLDEIHEEAKIQYKFINKNSDIRCSINLTNILKHENEKTNHFLDIRINPKKEKQFVVWGENPAICDELTSDDRTSNFYLYMTSLYNHPTTIAVTRKTFPDKNYHTPYLLNYQFYLLHFSYILFLVISLFDFRSKYFLWYRRFVYILYFNRTVVFYSLISDMVEYRFFDSPLIYKIIE
ncbi:hypothetical protein [Leptospira idonii]|uniref:Uncharacterized protein n=1 Tax=Leptospira idonii TaxID=1193500 RepID=A0A4R9LWA6_9LEPT|nr:hypothetical protein [Leptospira idonii]TGN18563.1 hypothetical protein EHS15_14350 [Leptospira idonii]